MSQATKLPEFQVPEFPGVEWIKSSASTPGTLDDCLSLGTLGNGDVAVADTKTQKAFALTKSEFAAFIAGAKNGEFDHLI